MERFKKYMDDKIKKDESITVSKCCDETLINELTKRGFEVKKGNENGKTTNKSCR